MPVPDRVARGLLALFGIAYAGLATAARMRIVAAQPAHVWVLAVLPLAALLLGGRRRGALVVALAEVAALVPLHAFLTLLRAARLEGG
jgi:hypothetical protein